ncbi:uncharacterized protein LOC111347648 [Stylophora pistillata]|uniref:uncharacterized protein LOC111347648 n=1 Tax=Stylophora pistillata TaxID=50429 RepID=UPI000C05698A|nr:uncharacterized protein LOC111347648 [Stylophora pistillata]
MSQYDSAGYQQGSQSSDTNVAQANNNDAGQIEGGQQPSSLEQAIQLQQESYTQQPQEQGQEEQGTELVGQEGQATDGGQLQYQSEQTGQEQEQGGQEGVQEQGRGQTGFEQSEYQQEQAPDPNEQQSHSQGLEQQLQQQAQSQEYQPQAQEEPQESEGAPVESQTLATSSNSLGNLFSSEGQQTAEQEGQGTVSYSSEQPIEGAEKGAPPGIQYASSIEEALKEPAETPPESTNDGGENQGTIGGTDSANAINIGGGSDSKEENNGYIGAGTVTAPSTYQSTAFDDNGNTLQPGTAPDANAYASENDQTSNSEATGFDGNQPSPSASPPEEQGSYGLAGQQFKKPGPGPKVPSLEDDFYKIINIANKNGPMAVKGCKGCPPHAKCIDKVCIINDDQPLAHMLNALSGPDPEEEPQGNECKDCHYNAKCINRECVCKAGYTGDGFDCRPDTCLPGCKQHGKCIKGFCVCDHHHYFNGYECAPYKITHRPCPIQCATECHARCPQSCCKHHRVLKIHYNDANPQQMNVPPNELPHKNASSPNPTAVLLRPESKLNEHLANFAPDFEQRPDDPEAANLEAISLKNPTGGFSVSEMEGRPLLQKEECPGECKTECRDSCPVRCCLGKCPLSWMESCHPSCPKTCCYSPGTNHIFPMLDPKVQENFMTTMIEKFCPKACKAKCNSNCPPICCERNSSDSGGIRSANVHQLKTEGKHGADSFRNAMSWFGMMNFVNMMYNMYGNLYGANHFNKIPFTPTDRKLKPIKPTKPQTTSILNPSKVNEVGVPESAAVSVLTCPNYCNKSCRQDCPPRCCESKSESKSLNAIGVPLKCPSSCKLYCSKSCPSSCCSKSSPPTPSGQHPTGGINVAKSLSISPSPHSPEPAPPPAPAPAPSLPRPPAACTPICPAYWYPQCLENCCQRGEVANKKSSKQLRAKNQGKQSYDTFFAKEPNGPSQDCPAVCRRSCGPSCPLRCCDRPISSPTATQPAAPSPSMNTPLCPGYCASQCFPACTISCCKAGFIKSNSNLNMPALSPSRREHRPPTITESFPLPPPAAVCHPGCSRSCYPNCDESCCRASAQVFRVPNSKPVGDSSHLTIKVPCPSECRPFNCLYYCHHDCCLPRSETRNLKRRGYKDLRRKFGVMRRAKTPILKPIFKAFGKRIAKKRTKIPSRSSQRNLPNKVH